MPDLTPPHAMDATVAFDDLLLERCFRSPCVLCQRAEPGYYVLWMVHRTGFVALVPLCPSCQRHPNTPEWLDHAMLGRLGLATEGKLGGRVTSLGLSETLPITTRLSVLWQQQTDAVRQAPTEE